jgi:hypothetical protein
MELRVLVLFLFRLTLNQHSALFDRSCALSMHRPGTLAALQTEPFSTFRPCRYVRWRTDDEKLIALLALYHRSAVDTIGR